MFSAPLPTSGERRGESRRPLQSLARLETTDARPVRPLEATIEERSPRGLRLRSRAPLMEGSALVLYPRGELRPLHARVVWARREATGSGRLDPIWRAGCRLQGDPEPRFAAPAPEVELQLRPADPDSTAVKLLVAAGLLSLAALFVYTVLRLAVFIGEDSAYLLSP